MGTDRVAVLSLLFICAQIYTCHGCTFPNWFQGTWHVYETQDGVTFTNVFNVTVSIDIMIGFPLEQFPTLIYYCYASFGAGRRSMAFRSAQAMIFDTYDVRIFLCWQLYFVNKVKYNVLERSGRVVNLQRVCFVLLHIKAAIEDIETPLNKITLTKPAHCRHIEMEAQI